MLVVGAREVDGVRGAQADPPVDFMAAVITFEGPLSRYLRHLVGDPELARDLVQDTFLSAYRAWPPADEARLSGWLYRIATNHALAHLRRKKLLAWLPFSRLGSAAAPEPRTVGHADRVATSEAVLAAVWQLDPAERACLLLKAAGFSSDEIAQQLGCSPGAARMRLSRARAAFRRHYAADGDPESD